MISLFLSTSDKLEDTEKKLWDELWGCKEYLRIPFDTLMTMPVYIRKFWILKHNEINSKQNTSGNNTSNSVDGSTINTYAEIEQSNRNVPK